MFLYFDKILLMPQMVIIDRTSTKKFYCLYSVKGMMVKNKIENQKFL